MMWQKFCYKEIYEMLQRFLLEVCKINVIIIVRKIPQSLGVILILVFSDYENKRRSDIRR